MIYIDRIKEYIKGRIELNEIMIHHDLPFTPEISKKVSIHNANIIELRKILKFIEENTQKKKVVNVSPDKLMEVCNNKEFLTKISDHIISFNEVLKAVNNACIKLIEDKEDV